MKVEMNTFIINIILNLHRQYGIFETSNACLSITSILSGQYPLPHWSYWPGNYRVFYPVGTTSSHIILYSVHTNEHCTHQNKGVFNAENSEFSHDIYEFAYVWTGQVKLVFPDSFEKCAFLPQPNLICLIQSSFILKPYKL